MEGCSIDAQIAQSALKLQQLMQAWLLDKARLAPIITEFEKLGGSATWFSTGLSLAITGDKDILTKAMRLLRTSGGEVCGDRPQENSPTWYGLFRVEGLTSEYIYLQFSSSVCRRVQVGTKLETVPVYETVCDEPPPKDPGFEEFLNERASE